jgi:hypothetical protein
MTADTTKTETFKQEVVFMQDCNRDDRPAAAGTSHTSGARRLLRAHYHFITAAGALFVLFCLAPGSGWAASAAVQEQKPETELETRVRARVSAYWTAMEHEDYAAATLMMHPDSRQAFEHKVPKSRVSAWRVKQVRCTPEKNTCEAVVLVSKPVAIFQAQIVEWPLRSEWVLLDGEWYFKLPWDEKNNPVLDMFRSQQESAAVTEPMRQPKTAKAPSGERVTMARIFTADPANPRTVHAGQKNTFRYYYSNKTSAPIKVVSVHADCHCTSVKADFPEVPVGEQGSIEVTLDTFGLPLGAIEKTIFVTFAHLKDPVTLNLNVTNEPNFTVTPASVDFGVIASGAPVELSVQVLNKSGRDVQFVSQLRSDPALEVTFPKSVAPGKTATIKLKYVPKSPGEFRDSLMLQTDLQSDPLITIPVKGKTKP